MVQQPEKAINCSKDFCNGVLVEGIKGFYKCTVCGIKIKSSIVHKMYGINARYSKKENGKFVKDPNYKPKPKRESKPKLPKEPKAPKIKAEISKIRNEKGILLVGLTTSINCSVCGKERIIKTQDLHQVTKCCTCQHEYRKKKRSDAMRRLRQSQAAAKLAAQQEAANQEVVVNTAE